MARPKAEIDWEKVDSYLRAQCDGTAIASLFGIHPDTLYNACEAEHKTGFSAYAATKRGEGKELLRMKMYQSAMKGDKTMQIWLSKQYLGFSDKQAVDHTTGGEKFNGFDFLSPIAAPDDSDNPST
jgi:hypothetical protein